MTRKKAAAKAPRFEPHVAVMPTPMDFGSPKSWVVTQHVEQLVVGGLMRGCRTTVVELFAYAAQNRDGPGIPGGFVLRLYDSSGNECAKYGPEYSSAEDLPGLRRKAVDWVAGILGSVARDLGLWIAEDNKRSEGP